MEDVPTAENSGNAKSELSLFPPRPHADQKSLDTVTVWSAFGHLRDVGGHRICRLKWI